MAGVRALPVHLTAERPERVLLGATDVRALAASVGLLPTKSLGQNFVIDGGTVERIVRTAALRPDDVILEIGPGLGSLTLALLPGVRRVVAVEIDQRLAGLLPETVAARLPSVADRLRVIHRDAMVLDATEIGHATAEPPTAIVANLPYNVAVPVLLTLLARLPSVRRVLVMVQLEVAERLAAKPAEDAYGVPSVKAAWYGDVRLAGTIGRQVFWPAPRVDSGLVALDRREPPETTVSREAVFAVIDAAFGQRRKTLRAALASWAGSPAAAETALRAAGIDP
ncbi:MAG: rRNA (adenine1518-N6/adenine1519-N6)-dimethyltransferase, partial [Actinomycetota bacterium]|nr:rRNA (adenine1518-N6/adenine1519-N6)-dimethyltransferase [Actinomycetota bacterium]